MGWWWALVPLLLAPAGLLDTGTQVQLVGLVVGLGLVWLTMRHPGPGLLAFTIATGLQRPLQALVLQVSSVPVARAAGFAKEALLAGVVLAALVAHNRHRHRIDTVDRVAFGLLALATAYLLVPLALRPLVEIFPASPNGWYPRALSLRVDVGLVVVLLAARSLRPDPVWRRRIVGAVVVIGVLGAAATALEQADASTWQRIENDVLELPRLRVLVYDADPAATPIGTATRGYTRAGAWTNSLAIPWLLVTAFAVVLTRTARAPTTGRIVATGVLGAGIVSTFTRSAVLAALVVIVVTAISFPRARAGPRRRLMVAASLGTVLLVGLTFSSGLSDRAIAAVTGDDASASKHATSVSSALQRTLDQPLGLGLGVRPSVLRSSDGPDLVAENAYLQLATEIGVAAGLLLLLLLWRLVQALRASDDPMGAALAGAVAGVGLAGMFLNVWSVLDGPWLLMLLCGLTLPRGSSTHEPVQLVQQRSGHGVPPEPRLHVGAAGLTQ